MSDHEWHDMARYNLVIPQKSMIKLYNIKSISHHYSESVKRIVYRSGGGGGSIVDRSGGGGLCSSG